MKLVLQKSASLLIITGIISLCFGLIVFIWPGLTVTVLVWLFAIPVVLQGISYITAALQNREKKNNWVWLLLIGIVSILGGLFAIFSPGITALFLVQLMGATWLAAGILLITVALRLRKEITNESWLILSGILSVVAGLFAIVNPGSGALALLWLIGIYAVLFGILMIVFGIRTRKWGRNYAEEVLQ